jgi:ClpP class serine protease
MDRRRNRFDARVHRYDLQQVPSDRIDIAQAVPVDTLKTLAGGRVWSGEQAKANQLVDQLGGLDDALAMVAKGAKLDKYKVVHRPEASTGLDLGQLRWAGG